MFTRITNYLNSPDDRDPVFINLVRNMLLLTLAANIAAILATSGILANSFNPGTFWALATTLFLELVALYSVIWRSNVQMGKYIVPTALVIAVTFIAANSNGIHDIVIVAYPVIIIMAFLLQGEKAIALSIPFVVAAFILLGILDMVGFTDSPIASRTGPGDIFIGIALSVAAATVLRLLTSRLNESLKLARQNEQAQISANEALRELQASLEQRVEERTLALSSSAQQNALRARRLEAIADIARSIALLQDLEDLLPEITRLISERFNFYHVGIFLLDDKQEYAILRAANSEGGRRMLNRQHKLKVESSSLVGYASIQKQARIALDVGADAVFFSNPDLPETCSEMALPMLVGSRVTGVLDVQSTQPSAFSPEDVQILTTLANQVSIAIENARLLKEARSAAEAADKVYKQYVSQGWQRATAAKSKRGYRSSGEGIDALAKPLSSAEIKRATEQGEMVVVEERRKSVLVMPIKVRDQVIGVLNVRSQEQGYRWDEEELTLVRSLSDRVSLALENARLLADAQRRASKERVIGQIADKISAAGTIEAILKTALSELGRSVNASQLSIQLASPDETAEGSQDTERS